MPTMRSALGLLGKSLSDRIKEISYDPKAVTSWEDGDLSGKLRQVQHRMRDAIRDARALLYIIHASRRIGKTFLMLLDAFETGLQEMNARLPFAAPTQKQMKKIILPIAKEITLDAPTALRPIWKASDQHYIFPKTASELPISGCSNGHEENLRGTSAKKAYVDEAQSFKNNLIYVVKDILMPQLLTTNGSMVISGTSPKTPVHDFVKLIQEAKLKGSYLTLPINAAGYPEDIIQRFMEEAGGDRSTTWRREYLCELVTDEESAIIPEWKAEFEYVPPRDEYLQFYVKHEGMDIGGRRDRTVVLFGWYDFRRATLFIDQELGIAPKDMTTQAIADGVKRVEVDIFGEYPLKSIGPGSASRIADNNNEILLRDLATLHKLSFAPTSKDTKEAMVNELRLWVKAGRVVVHPRCKETIGCLRYGIWNDKRNAFERFPEESDAHQLLGHFDALDALIYMVRNVNTHANPIPQDYDLPKKDVFVLPKPKYEDDEVIRQALTPRWRRR